MHVQGFYGETQCFANFILTLKLKVIILVDPYPNDSPPEMCMLAKCHHVTLNLCQRYHLKALITSKISPPLNLRARVLLKTDAGELGSAYTDEQIEEAPTVSRRTIQGIRTQCCLEPETLLPVRHRPKEGFPWQLGIQPVYRGWVGLNTRVCRGDTPIRQVK